VFIHQTNRYDNLTAAFAHDEPPLPPLAGEGWDGGVRNQKSEVRDQKNHFTAKNTKKRIERKE